MLKFQLVKQILAVLFIVILTVGLIAIAFTVIQTNQESQRLESDLERRSTLLAASLTETIEPSFLNNSDQYLQNLVERFQDRERLAGLAIYDNNENIVSLSSTLPKEITDTQKIAANSMDEDRANDGFANVDGKKMYLFAIPLHDQERIAGSLVIIHKADYIDVRLSEIWKNNLTRLFLQILLLTIAGLLMVRWLLFQPLRKLTESLKSLRPETVDQDAFPLAGSMLFQPLTKEISNIKKSLIDARMAASEEAKVNLERLDSPWTAERLKVFVKDILKNRKIVVVSNREPYIHSKSGNKINFFIPASGMVTAIEPMMEACGGTWIAHGSGDADNLVVDKNNKIKVPPPPDEPKYGLKRVWLTENEEKGYYYGFSNEGLWPLCHIAHTRPIFKKKDWEEYKKVNHKFAQAVLLEIKNLKKPMILVQDFHFALLPRIVKNSRPDASVSIFWHIPWVSAESFSICPWKKEILNGMLGADLIGFHTQLHLNNFIETVERELETLIDFEQFTITHADHKTYIKPFPISIAFYNDTRSNKDSLKTDKEKTQKEFGVETRYLGVGVDRLDYTKGILERLKGIEILLQKYPSYRRHLTFIQIAAPSRTRVQKYQDFAREVEEEVERINSKYKEKNWKPIIYVEKRLSHDEINKIFRAANFCLVTSLHDGMNLVAKEFIAARNDEQGVLILSQFTGASRELKDAIIINPYNGEQTAEAIHLALKMSAAAQKKRMQKLRQTIRNHNVYRWSAEFLRAMVNLG